MVHEQRIKQGLLFEIQEFREIIDLWHLGIQVASLKCQKL